MLLPTVSAEYRECVPVSGLGCAPTDIGVPRIPDVPETPDVPEIPDVPADPGVGDPLGDVPGDDTRRLACDATPAAVPGHADLLSDTARDLGYEHLAREIDEVVHATTKPRAACQQTIGA